MEKKEYTGNWYKNLLADINTLGEQLALDEHAVSLLRDFAITTAKNQYKAGNKSGIRWARMNPSPSQG